MPVEGYGDGEKFSAARVSPQAKEIGRVKLTILHNVEKNCLEVLIAKIDDLDRLEVGNDPLDMYIRLCLYPNEDVQVRVCHSPTSLIRALTHFSHSQFRSRIQKKTLSPVFDETYTFRESLHDLKKKRVHLTLWSYVSKKNTLIGEVAIDLHSIPERGHLDTWMPLLKPTKMLEDDFTIEDEPRRILFCFCFWFYPCPRCFLKVPRQILNYSHEEKAQPGGFSGQENDADVQHACTSTRSPPCGRNQAYL